MAIPIGLQGSEDALRRALAGSISAIETGITRGTDVARPFTEAGGGAINLQAALSGALGPDAQRQAFADFSASPGQEFLTGEAEKALLRNQAAIGGIGGGNVRRALQEQAIGLASQDFGNQFTRLGDVSNLGAALSGQLTGLEFGAGRDVADLVSGTGRDVAGGRTRAGEQIAGAIGGTTSALADLAERQGTGLSGVLGAGGGNLANLLSGAGGAEGLSIENLAALLANLATGEGSQLAGVGQAPGVQQTPGRLDDIGKLLTAIGTL